MDPSSLDFDEPPALRWQSVISEAEKQNAMGKLVPVLLARYPDNSQLKAACLPFTAADPISAPPSQAKGAPAIPPGSVLVPKFEASATPSPEPPPIPPSAGSGNTAAPAEPIALSDDEAAATIISLRLVAVEVERRLRRIENWQKRVSMTSSDDLSQDSEHG